MKLTELYNEVARKADTAGTKINAAEVRRVLASFFDVLEDLEPHEAFDIVNMGLKSAAKRRR